MDVMSQILSWSQRTTVESNVFKPFYLAENILKTWTIFLDCVQRPFILIHIIHLCVFSAVQILEILIYRFFLADRGYLLTPDSASVLFHIEEEELDEGLEWGYQPMDPPNKEGQFSDAENDLSPWNPPESEEMWGWIHAIGYTNYSV